MRIRPIRRATLVLGLFVGLGFSAAAPAEEHDAGFARSPRYEAECSSCHIAFPPRLLPAPSWQRIIAGLSNHFGTDASVEPPVAAELSAWLTAHARQRGCQEAPPDDRISRSRWFLSQHDDIAAPVWKRDAVRSAANCQACHRGAAQGRFDENAVLIPK
jgi:Dihaem cytochrome c